MGIKFFFWKLTPCWLVNRTDISDDINASIFRVKQSKRSWVNLAWNASLHRSLRFLSMLRSVQTITGAIQPPIYWVLDAHFFKWWGIQFIHASVPSTENRRGWSHPYTPPTYSLKILCLNTNRESFPSAAPLTATHECTTERQILASSEKGNHFIYQSLTYWKLMFFIVYKKLSHEVNSIFNVVNDWGFQTFHAGTVSENSVPFHECPLVGLNLSHTNPVMYA